MAYRHMLAAAFAASCILLMQPDPASAQGQPPGEEEADTTGGIDTDGPLEGQPTYQELLEEVMDLRERVEKLEADAGAESQGDDLEALLEAVDDEITEAEVSEEPETESEEVFLSGMRALQATNPEISVTGDLVGVLYLNEDFFTYDDSGRQDGLARSGFHLRGIELSIQANLDPFSFTKVNMVAGEEGLEVEEAYVTWGGVLPRFTLTVGRFLQQFGTVNRWHEHAFDQVDRPYVHHKFLGPEGLSGTGLAMVVIIPPAWAHAQELSLEVTNGENENLFAGEFFSIPTVLGHLKSYWDLAETTYLELGFSGVWGMNSRRGVVDPADGTVSNEKYRNTVVAGVDLNLVWAKPGQAKYRGLAWRSEFLYLYEETREGRIDAFGGFTYLDVRVSPYVIFGARFDVGQDPETLGETWFWQASPYVTFWQSEFVYLRLQYNATWESGTKEIGHALMLQTDWSMGPHRHEKY